MRSGALSAITVMSLACSSPDFLLASILGGQAEVISDAAGVRVVGSFDVQLVVPSSGEPTDFLLLRLAGRYRHDLDCPLGAAQLQLSPHDAFPLSLQPGTTTTTTIDLVDSPAAVAQGCGPVEQLALSGHYYDSVVDDYLDRAGTPITGVIPVDPGAAGGPNDWTCLDQLSPPTFSPGSATGIIWIRERPSGYVVPGITIRVCGLTDPGCDSPFDEGVTDIVGYWPLSVPTSGPFYFEVSGNPTIAPALFFEHAPPGDSGFERTLTPLSTEVLAQAGVALGTTVSATRGHVIVEARDCDGEPATGVTFELDPSDPGVPVGYWQDGVISPDLGETATDGQALFLNVPASTTTVTARLAVTGDIIATRYVNLRAAATTVVSIDPTPAGS